MYPLYHHEFIPARCSCYVELIRTSHSRENKLPYFWAGPILTGKAETINASSEGPWKNLFAGGVAILLLVYGASIAVKSFKSEVLGITV